MLDNILIGENDMCKFYKNDFTISATDYARKPDLQGITLSGWSVLLAEFKTSGNKEYILLNDKNEIVESNQSYESIGVSIDKYKLLCRI